MSWQIVRLAQEARIQRSKKLVHADKLILIGLANYASDEGVCFPGIKRIAEWSGCSERTAWTSLQRLANAGVIDMIQAGRQHHHAHYRINVSHAVFASLEEARVAEVATLELGRPANVARLTDGRPEDPASLAVPDSQNSLPDSQNLRPFLVLTSKTDTAGDSPAPCVSGDRVSDGDAPARATAPDRYAAEFEAVQEHYPKRDGDQKWRLAERHFVASRKRGEPLEAILAGVKRYAAYCVAKGWVGTEYVKQAASFLGREECWREEWKPSAPQPRRGPRDSNFGRSASGFVG